MPALQSLTALSRALDTRIARIVADAGVPAAAVAIAHRGQHYAGAWGAGTETLFDLGSCSKSFAATVIALLVGDGTLTFDDPVRRWLPEMQLDSAKASAQLTIRDLLCNRIGLKRQIPLETFANPELSALDVVRRVRHLDRLHPFRKGYVYFNPGFMAARLIVERASGMDYGEFLERRLFGPLGMTRSASGSARVARYRDRARGHVRVGDRMRRVGGGFDNWQGAAGVHSCAADAARWLQFVLDGGAPLIPAAVFAQTQQPHTVMPRAESKLIHCPPEAADVRYCLGWWKTTLHGQPLVQHAGEMFGWRAHVATLPGEGIGVAVMLSAGVPRHAAIAYTVLETLLTGHSRDWCVVADAMAEQLAANTRQLLAVAFPADRDEALPLSRYAGTYRHPALGRVRITRERKGLALRFVDGRLWDLSLTPLGGHVFETRAKHLPAIDYMPTPLRLRFDVKRGKVVALVDTQARYARARPTKGARI